MRPCPAIRAALVLTVIPVMLVTADWAAAAVQEVVTGLSRPVRLVAPVGDDRLFVVQRTGEIRIFDQQGIELGTFLDISDSTTNFSERGLLGLAFPPDFATNPRVIINHTDPDGHTRIVRYTVSAANPDSLDPATREVLLTVQQPYGNHNGGHLEFGSDGMLYIGLGDGGASGDPENRAQDDTTLLGKMLRIDVSPPVGYAVPPDNPHVGEAPLDEIWAKGLRNPWCFSFDSGTGDLYIADVGQNVLEEINVQPAGSSGGENYGWRLMEGTDCFNPSSGCDDGSLVPPDHTYTHTGSPANCSISGGYVYRGDLYPGLKGRYLFADYCSNRFWSLTWTAAGGAGGLVDHTTDLTPTGGYGGVASFGQDGHDELYVLDYERGRVYRIIDTPSAVPEAQGGHFLAQNAPNPFNPSTEIAFTVGGGGERVRLTVYDLAGRVVRTLVDDVLPAGDHVAFWTGTAADGRPAGSGVYVYRLMQGRTATSRTMVLLE